MELKDAILSTLAELQDDVKPVQKTPTTTSRVSIVSKQEQVVDEPITHHNIEVADEQSLSNELVFLTNLKERLLVLFEGFQAPNNASLEAKIDLTLNFLEYILVNIENRIEQIKGKE